MTVGSDCLVCINHSLVLAKLKAVYQYTVVVDLYGEAEYKRQAVAKNHVISIVSSEALDAIKTHQFGGDDSIATNHNYL